MYIDLDAVYNTSGIFCGGNSRGTVWHAVPSQTEAKLPGQPV